MIEINRLDHFVLTVKDINIAVDFYVNVLGMKKEIFKGSRIALRYGHQKINLHKLNEEFEPHAFNVQTGSADLCFIINTPIQEAKEHIESLGVEILEGIVPRAGANGAMLSLYLRDPDMNLIELSNYNKKG